MAAPEIYLAAYARTPFGRFFGALRELPGPALAARTIDALLDRSGLEPDCVDGVYAGVGMAGGGVFTAARQALLQSRLPDHTPSLGVDRACCSGMTAIGLGWRDLLAGQAGVVICGGFESLSRAPGWITRSQRTTPGDPAAWTDGEIHDPLQLISPVDGRAIASYTGEEALARGISREMQDEWAVASHARYFAANERGCFDQERVSLAELATDESPRRDTSPATLARLKTIYSSPTITAGNAPGLSDGAAFVILATEARARELGLPLLARVVDHVSVAEGPTSGSYTPAIGIQRLLARGGHDLDALALLEINEAYAATPLVSTLHLAEGDVRLAEALRKRSNVNGGAVAIGHPLGASGARIVMTLAGELQRRGGGLGAAAICGGFGQGDALLLEVDAA